MSRVIFKPYQLTHRTLKVTKKRGVVYIQCKQQIYYEMKYIMNSVYNGLKKKSFSFINIPHVQHEFVESLACVLTCMTVLYMYITHNSLNRTGVTIKFTKKVRLDYVLREYTSWSTGRLLLHLMLYNINIIPISSL
jgi:hypothetical protein